MNLRRLLVLSGMWALGGCLYQARERTDEALRVLAERPYDLLPGDSIGIATEASSASKQTRSQLPIPAHPLDVQTVAYMQPAAKPKIEPKIPAEIPGSEAKPIELPKEPAAKQRAIEQLYPELPPLPAQPIPQLGPNGRPYTLADLQQIAASNSPELRQATSDVEAARGNWLQAKAYPNPTVGWNIQPSNDGSTAGAQGPFVDQTIKFAGKLKLAAASAEMDLRNAELALRRARSDLATRVRNAYFAVMVGREMVRVNEGLARYTDEIYRLHTGLLGAGAVASYEPMALRALAYTARLGHKQAIQTYIYSWKQLVAAIGLQQLPLSEVAGRIDAVIPYFDYDTVRAYVLKNHTDVLTARNGIDKARYNLKQAQITPYPDVDINLSLLKEYALPPKQTVVTATIGVPFPIWDQNKGAIIAAESALVRASEEPHHVSENLTTALATAYMNYKTNLDALEYYRRFILPDQVRAYRGVLARRQIDPNVAFADLLGAQQTLASDVTAYLGILSSLWSSVVSVADLLETDDLFQMAKPREVPALPDLDHLETWPCCHPSPAACVNAPVPSGVRHTGATTTPGSIQPLEFHGLLTSSAVSKPIAAQPAAPAAPEVTGWSLPQTLFSAPRTLPPLSASTPPTDTSTAPVVSGWRNSE